MYLEGGLWPASPMWLRKLALWVCIPCPGTAASPGQFFIPVSSEAVLESCCPVQERSQGPEVAPPLCSGVPAA